MQAGNNEKNKKSSDKTAAFKFNRVCKQKTVDESEEAAPRELIVLKNGASEQQKDS